MIKLLTRRKEQPNQTVVDEQPTLKKLSNQEITQELPGHITAILKKLKINPINFVKFLRANIDDLRNRRQEIVSFNQEVINFFNYLKATGNGKETLFDILESIRRPNQRLHSIYRMFTVYREKTLNS